jgi:hypothetical protein
MMDFEKKLIGRALFQPSWNSPESEENSVLQIFSNLRRKELHGAFRFFEERSFGWDGFPGRLQMLLRIVCPL